MVGLGFFYLSDSPLESERDRLFALTRRFFSSNHTSPEEKRSIEQEKSRHFRGWSGLGLEHTQDKPDNREQIDLGIESPAFPQGLQPHYLNLYGPNQFPASIPELRDAVLSYMEKAEEVTVHLTKAIEMALGVEEGRLGDCLGLEGKEEGFEKIKALAQRSTPPTDAELEDALPRFLPYERMKLVKYGSEGNPQGVGAHRDGGWITLLATDQQPGLQVEDVAGQWIDVPYKPGCILVNFGQQLERVSSGLIRAATHRVHIYPSPDGRVSLPYFSMPSLRAVIDPIPRGEMSAEALQEEESRDAEKRMGGRKTVVPEGDLHGSATEEFGHTAWRSLIRSHPNTFQRWYGKLGA